MTLAATLLSFIDGASLRAQTEAIHKMIEANNRMLRQLHLVVISRGECERRIQYPGCPGFNLDRQRTARPNDYPTCELCDPTILISVVVSESLAASTDGKVKNSEPPMRVLQSQA